MIVFNSDLVEYFVRVVWIVGVVGIAGSVGVVVGIVRGW